MIVDSLRCSKWKSCISRVYSNQFCSFQSRRFASNNGQGGHLPVELQIDRSNLIGAHRTGTPIAPLSPNASPLTSFLYSMISLRGPMSTYEFMQQALNHPTLGYYKKRDVFGRKGDFITSPELSQVFSELIGIWIVYFHQQILNSPSQFQLVEVGPGRGTLMSIMLKTLSKFPALKKSLKHVHFVETSDFMRLLQSRLIMNPSSNSSSLRADPALSSNQGVIEFSHTQTTPSSHPYIPDLSVSWHNDLQSVPSGLPTIIIAHEFLDALPAHQFAYVSSANAFRERLVDLSPASASSSNTAPDDPFRIVLAPGPTPASIAYEATLEAQKKLVPVEDGSILEVSPYVSPFLKQLSDRISTDNGGCLLIDYGHDLPSMKSSIRGIRNHEFIPNFLTNVGDLDLSVDVQWSQIKAFLELDNRVSFHGTTTQGNFLASMGIEARMRSLLSDPKLSNEMKDELISQAYRLVNPDEMGSIYKFFAITQKSVEKLHGF
jgi:NADH dehydrogenase [ubiquinone] 1 alpha subcomplex assembly factor 7